MKLILLAALVFFSAPSLLEQSRSQVLFPVTENGKYGFANVKGELVIQPQFELASSFSEGLAWVIYGGKYGYIDEKGKWVAKPQFDEAEDFSEGFAAVIKDYQCGFIDARGKQVIPLAFVECLSFSDGLAAIHFQPQGSDTESKWGYIDKKGNVAIPAKFHKAFDFHDGVAKVIEGKFGEDNPQRFIDKLGNFITSTKYSLTGELSEGLIPVEVGGQNKKLGERSYQHISGKWGYVDKTGKLVIAPKFDHADEFSEELANVTVNKKYGYINKSGEFVIPPQFEYSSNSYRCAVFVEGRACFERDGKIGFIDTKGNVVIEPKFEFASKFLNGVAQVNFGVYPETRSEHFPVHGNYGLIDKVGRVIYKPSNKAQASASQSKPVDPKAYEGWQKIDEGWFSFYAPVELKGGQRRGIDSTVYVYESADLRLGLDIGMYGVAVPSADSVTSVIRRSEIIDGQKASIWHAEGERGSDYKYSSGVSFQFGKDFNKAHFSMYLLSKNAPVKEVSEKIFASLRFKFTH